MKKTLILSLVISFLFSCKKETPEEVPVTPEIVAAQNTIQVNGVTSTCDEAVWDDDTSSGYIVISKFLTTNSSSADNGYTYLYFNKRPSADASYRITGNEEFYDKFSSNENLAYAYLNHYGKYYSKSGTVKVKAEANNKIRFYFNNIPMDSTNNVGYKIVSYHNVIAK